MLADAKKHFLCGCEEHHRNRSEAVHKIPENGKKSCDCAPCVLAWCKLADCNRQRTVGSPNAARFAKMAFLRVLNCTRISSLHIALLWVRGQSSFCVPCVGIDRSIDEMGINYHCPPFFGKLLRPSTSVCWVSDAEYRRSTPRHQNMLKPQTLSVVREGDNGTPSGLVRDLQQTDILRSCRQFPNPVRLISTGCCIS